MKKYMLFLAGAFAATALSAQSWTLDKSHAKLGFSITHMMVSDVEGNFKSFDVKLQSANEDFTDAKIELTADINSINTDNEGRDKHLRGADFFDAEKYPTLSFKSKSFKKVDTNKYVLGGDLTMHGVTKEVTLYVTLRGTTVHPYNKKTVAGFKVNGTLKRSDFGVGSGTPEAVLGDEITISSNLELTKD
jgi:polyisoprenoid-binding protein YceI